MRLRRPPMRRSTRGEIRSASPYEAFFQGLQSWQPFQRLLLVRAMHGSYGPVV